MRPILKIKRSTVIVLLFVAVVSVHVGLGLWIAYRYSPTIDEPRHLLKGLRLWENHDFDFASGNTPLPNALVTWPVRLQFPEIAVGSLENLPLEQFRPGEFRQALFISRACSLLFSVAGAICCFLWGKELYGELSGLIASVLWCASPNVLGHAPLVTCDIAVTSLGLWAAYLFWRLLEKPNWSRAIFSGLSLGLAMLAKYVAVVLFVLFPIYWGVRLALQNEAPERKELIRQFFMLGFILCLAILVVNAGYLFYGTLQPLASYTHVCENILGISKESFLARWLLVPVPEDYIRGAVAIDSLLASGHRSFLAGSWRDQGWWYYYLYGMGVKVTLGVLLLSIVNVCGMFRNGVRQSEWFVVVTFVALLAFVSSLSSMSHHFRYVFPALPYLFLLASRSFATFSQNVFPSIKLSTFVVLWCVLSSLVCYPHNASYFNELAGGPKSGKHHLLDSNIDWGQDLVYLRDWMEDHEIEKADLVYFGAVDPSEYDVDFDFPRPSEQGTLSSSNRYMAVSVNFLEGLSFLTSHGGSRFRVKPDTFVAWRDCAPVGSAGYSILVFDTHQLQKREEITFK